MRRKLGFLFNLFFSKDDCVEKRVDTEIERSMFGTLVIQLPSVYTGGEMIVHNDGTHKEIDFGGDNGAYSIHFAAHHANLEYEIKSITSGNRLMLKYSLYSECCLTLNRSILKLTSILEDLHKADKYIAISLEHQYSPEFIQNCGAKALKDKDLHYFNILKSLSFIGVFIE